MTCKHFCSGSCMRTDQERTEAHSPSGTSSGVTVVEAVSSGWMQPVCA